MLTRRPVRRVGDPVAVDLLRLRASVGVDVGDVDHLPPRLRRALAVATAVGAPALDALEGAAAAEEDARRAARAVAVASAQTRTVAVGLVLAPLLLVPGLGRLVGVDLVGFYTTPGGVVVAGVAGLLVATGAALVLRLVRRVGHPPAARPAPARVAAAVVAATVTGALLHVLLAPVVGVVVLRTARSRPGPLPVGDEAVDLTATAMAGGVAPGEALRTAAAQLPGLARPLRRMAFELELDGRVDAANRPGRAAAATALDRLGAVLQTAVTIGAPVVPTLRRLARDLRADDLARVLAAAERLPAQLTFPTALCLLPATVLLVGAPIVHAGLVAAGT